MEEKINFYNLIVSGYFGVCEMDEYPLKEYVLMEIKKYLENYCINNPYNYSYEIAKEKANTNSLKTKLQDSLIVLNEINASYELILMIKQKIKELEN